MSDGSVKSCLKVPWRFCLLLTVFNIDLDGVAAAETFTTLHRFTGIDGAGPYAGLVVSGNTLYGTTYSGGSSNQGTVFGVGADGAGFRILHSFNGGSDGDTPLAGLILGGNAVYGTTFGPGFWNATVFKVNTDGADFTNIFSFGAVFAGANGPRGGLILSSNTLYGTTTMAGTWQAGTVFSLNVDGTDFTNLHSFTSLSNNTNSDGASPEGTLILSNNTLYGMTSRGGSSGNGTIFKILPDGTFSLLHSFSATTGKSVIGWPTNDDGTTPRAALISSEGTLYGTTSAGGSFGSGTVFKLNTDGTGFQVLHNFDMVPTPLNNPTNTDGSQPLCTLVLLGKTLYGTTSVGGPWGNGTVFAISIDGTDFITLHSFTGGSDGISPLAGLVFSGNTLYGTANGGGLGYGTVFSLSFPPQLSSMQSGADLILTWPTNYAGFDYAVYTLQSTSNLVSPVWTTNSVTPLVVNGQNTVTNSISGTQQFFRLAQ